jgi:hypothetical protein
LWRCQSRYGLIEGGVFGCRDNCLSGGRIVVVRWLMVTSLLGGLVVPVVDPGDCTTSFERNWAEEG